MAHRASLIHFGIGPHPRSLQGAVWPQLTPYFFPPLTGTGRAMPRGEAVAHSAGGGRLQGLTHGVVLELLPSLSQVPHLHEAQVRRLIALVAM